MAAADAAFAQTGSVRLTLDEAVTRGLAASDRLDELSADWSKPPSDKTPTATAVGATDDGESRGLEVKCLDKSRVLSAVDLTIHETLEVVKASKADYTRNVADESKLVIASMAWSPSSASH